MNQLNTVHYYNPAEPAFVSVLMNDTRFTIWNNKTRFISSDSLKKNVLPYLSKFCISLSSFLWNVSDISLVCLCFLSFPSRTVKTSHSVIVSPSTFLVIQQLTDKHLASNACDSVRPSHRCGGFLSTSFLQCCFSSLRSACFVCEQLSEGWIFSQHGTFWLKFRWLINQFLNTN